jgi:hypothetical protein
MPEQLLDGTGTGRLMKIDGNNQAHVFAVTEDESRQANELGNEYNLNTGLVAYTGSSASSLVYFKNEEDPVNGESEYIITGLIVFMGIRSGSVTDYGMCEILLNPDTGDIISDATAGTYNSNTNAGSTNTLSTGTLFYKGKDGGTLSGGQQHALVALAEGRNAISLNIALSRGSSIGATIDLNTSGGANAYCALIGYRKNGNNN